MIMLVCEECGMGFEVDERRILRDEYIQCVNPECMRISKNPLYEYD